MLVSDSYAVTKPVRWHRAGCFCVNNGCPNDALAPSVTRLLCIWWPSSGSQAMIQGELLLLHQLPITATQWEDAQIVWVDERQIRSKVGRQGWISAAPTSFFKSTIGEVSISCKILSVVLYALTNTRINRAPFPSLSCHLEPAMFKYPAYCLKVAGNR